MNIERLRQQFKELAEESSRLKKEDILLKYSSDVDFKFLLNFLLDTHKVVGISKKRISKQVSSSKSLSTFEELFEYLQLHSTGDDDTLAVCKNTVVKLCEDTEDPDENVKFVYDIITRDLRVGVDVKTCQKIYGKDFIHTLDVMLGTSIENCTIPEGAKFFISQKLNGTRCFYYRGQLYTRQGKAYTGCEHIIKDIESILDGYVVDGELVLKETGLSDSEAFQKGTGIANSKLESKTDLKLVIFDMLSVEEFENGQSIHTYSYRKNQLKELQKRIESNSLKNISIVPMFYEGNDTSKIWEWLDYAEKHDMEGIMINLDALYEGKRTKNLIKVKKFYTYDLQVVGLEEGTGRNLGKLGALIVDFRGNHVKVGSGFSDEMRDFYWKNPDKILNRVIEVKYKEITTNKEGKQSLQFPVFVALREEGKEVSFD